MATSGLRSPGTFLGAQASSVRSAGGTRWIRQPHLNLIETWVSMMHGSNAREGGTMQTWTSCVERLEGLQLQSCALPFPSMPQVNPNILREKWSAAEDATLVQLVGQLGHRWAEIARHLPGRTDQQCLGRWRRHLDPSVRRVGRLKPWGTGLGVRWPKKGVMAVVL